MEDAPNERSHEERIEEQRQLARNLRGMAGLYVASSGSEVVANSKTFQRLLKQVDLKEVDRVWRIPRHRKLMLGRLAVSQT